MKTILPYVSTAALVLVLAACGGDAASPTGSTTTTTTGGTTSTPSTPSTPAPVAKVTLSPGSCTLTPGYACQFSAALTDASSNTLTGRTITWTSSASATATVSTSGLVTGVAAGTATVTATSEGISASVSITVASTAAATVVVQADAASTGGAVADLFGANRKPLDASQGRTTTWDGAALYQAFGITAVRLSDGGPQVCNTYTSAVKLNAGVNPATPVTGCTLSGTGGLPHFKWTPASTADSALNNTANYNFSATDSAVSAVLASGGKVYLRTGDGFNGPNDTDDPVAVAKVMTNIYRHVIGAFKPSGVTADPAYVEVMNEPDGGFWQGPASRFDTLFTETVTRIRAAAAAAGKTVVIGGPAFTQNYLTKVTVAGNVANGFIGAVNASTLDFFSVHWYGNCGSSMLAQATTFFRGVRSYIDGQGLSGKPLHISEWNIGLGQNCGESQYADQRMESYASAMLTFMQDPAQNIRSASFYAGMPIMALFDFGSATGKVRVNPGAWAFWAHTKLKGGTMISTQVCPGGSSCVNGYAAEAQALQAIGATSGSARTIVVTNDGSSSVTYTLRVKGLGTGAVTATVSTPPAGTQDVAASGSPVRADATALAALIASPTKDTRTALVPVNGQVELTLTLAAHTIHLVEVR